MQNSESGVVATTTGQLVPGADPKTFVALNKIYGKDVKHVYAILRYEPETIPQELPDADPNTFQYVGGGYSKDASNVYWWYHQVLGADPKSLVLVDEYAVYAKDDHQIYIGQYPIHLSFDVKTFVHLSSGYFKDSKNVYWGENDGIGIMKDADSATFSLISGRGTYDAQDKNHKYLNGHSPVGFWAWKC